MKNKEKLLFGEIGVSESRAYYDAFTSYHKEGDLVPMLGIFAEREHQRLLEYLSAIG